MIGDSIKAFFLRIKEGGKESKVSFLSMLLVATFIYLLNIFTIYVYIYIRFLISQRHCVSHWIVDQEAVQFFSRKK